MYYLEKKTSSEQEKETEKKNQEKGSVQRRDLASWKVQEQGRLQRVWGRGGPTQQKSQLQGGAAPPAGCARERRGGKCVGWEAEAGVRILQRGCKGRLAQENQTEPVKQRMHPCGLAVGWLL